ncbi:hypothetical protein Tco_1453305 [Tanacetum coccineum]
MANKLLALIRQRLNVTTITGEVTLLENAWHHGIRGIDIEIFQAEEGPTNFVLIAHLSLGSSSSSSSNSEVRDNSIIELKNQLVEALRENDDLKLKLEKFETSSKNLTNLLNSQISVNNKTGISFDSQMTENELHDIHKNKSEVFKKVEGYHAVPPPYTRNYMPSRPDLSFAGLDDSVYKTNVSETITSVPRKESTTSKFSKDNLEQPKDVRLSAPIVEEWESNSDDDCMTRPSIEHNKPRRVTGQREVRPGWNNAQRVNHQNKLTHPHPKRNFVPTVVLTKSGNVLVNTAKHSSWKRIFTKGRKTKPKTTKLSTEWKSMKRRSQIEAKKSTKSKSQQESQTVKVKVKRKSKSEEI